MWSVTQSCPICENPWTLACQAPLSMRYSRQEYWSGLPCPPPGDLPDPGIWTCVSYASCIGRWILYHCTTWEAHILYTVVCILEKAMAPHSGTLAWKIPWTEEPGRVQSMRSLRVGHDWVTSLSLFTFTHWRRKWQPTPGFLPGESQGRGSLVGCCLWGCTESDTT